MNHYGKIIVNKSENVIKSFDNVIDWIRNDSDSVSMISNSTRNGMMDEENGSWQYLIPLIDEDIAGVATMLWSAAKLETWKWETN